MNEGLNLNLGCTLFDYQPESVNTKPVLITSGTTGIGRAIAIRLAAQGAQLMLSGRHEQELNDAL
jgi:NAD(P)-dependent dehydrogenase (short-subunit alcohol dehydrogenase family)